MRRCLSPNVRPLGVQALAVAAICSAAALAAEPVEPAEPISLHPQNGHYFVWRGVPTILITSGEHYGALLNLDFDFLPYFDALQVDRLNHTRVFSGTYREIPSSFGITDNPLAPKPNRYACPGDAATSRAISTAETGLI